LREAGFEPGELQERARRGGRRLGHASMIADQSSRVDSVKQPHKRAVWLLMLAPGSVRRSVHTS
jgi:hypothetical protein